MAQINIERRNGGYGLWILAILVVLVVIVALVAPGPPTAVPVAAGGDSAGPGQAVAESMEVAGTIDYRITAVDSFLSWTGEREGASRMGLDHSHTATGIRRLASALLALAGAGGGAPVGDDLRRVRALADTLEQDPTSTRHARHARTMFVSLSGLMSAMQQARFPELANETAAVVAAAEAVRADRPLLDQRGEVIAFFDRAAVVIREMSGPAR